MSFSFGKENNLTFSRASLTLKADRAGGQGYAPNTTNTSMVVKKSKKFCHMPSLCNIIKLYLKKQPEVALSYHLT